MIAHTYLYCYTHGNERYYFGWQTPYNEVHRGFSKTGPAMWYDEIRPGDTFEIKICDKDPVKHYLNDAVFGNMNNGVCYFGKE